jgi:copper(I)-binding protein
MRPIAVIPGLALLLAVAAGGPVAAQQAGGIVVEGAWARRAPMMGQAGPGHPAAAPAGQGAAPAAGHGAAPGHPGPPASGHGLAGPMRGHGAVYVTLRNDGAAPDAVLAVASDAAEKAELHEARHDEGMIRMRPVPRLAIPAGGRVEMKPGGYHIMLLGLTRDLMAGDTVKVTLTLEQAGTLSVEAPVR